MSLRQLCKDKGYTFVEISYKTSISLDYLSKLNTGKKNNPSSEILEKLSGILNVSTDTIIKSIRG